MVVEGMIESLRPLAVDVHVVVGIFVCQTQLGEADGGVYDFSPGLHAASEPHRDVEHGGYLGVEGNLCSYLDGCHLFGVEACSRLYLGGLPCAGFKGKRIAVMVSCELIVGLFIVEIYPHGGGDELRVGSINAVSVFQAELSADEILVFRGRADEVEPAYEVFLFHRLRLLTGYRADLIVGRDADSGLECHEFVPVPHGFFLTAVYERVDGFTGEARRTVRFGVHADGHIGDGQILVVLVLAVHIHDLA